MTMRFIFIGGGNMAEAIFSKLENKTIIVVQRNPQKLAQLKTTYPHIQFMARLNFKTTADDLVFLTIKPQDSQSACQNIKEYTQDSTIVSVIAGINCQTLAKWLNNDKICRTMPNTPIMLGLGTTAIYFTPAINQPQLILDIFAQLGQAYAFDDEDKINQMTAIASSSPAYVFYYIEALIKSAVNHFGFSPELAKEITLQIVKGSLAMIENNQDISIEQLRNNITSKKGTTEQAIRVLEQYNLNKIISEAELACYNRAKELAQLFTEN